MNIAVFAISSYWNAIVFHFRLVDVLRDFGKHDWQLSSMVCQILWNYRCVVDSCEILFNLQFQCLYNSIIEELVSTCSIHFANKSVCFQNATITIFHLCFTLI